MIKVNVSHKRPTMQWKNEKAEREQKERESGSRGSESASRFAFWITCHLNNDQSTREKK